MKNNISLTIASTGHFLIDFSCAYVVLSRLHESTSAAQILIIYNFMAFAMQMPFGIIADAYPQFKWSILGTFLVIASLFPWPLIVTVLLIGLGNSLYHLGEGKPILDHLHGSSALGIFVAPGAYGITLGTMLANSSLSLSWLLGFALLVLCVLLMKINYEGEPDTPSKISSKCLIAGLFIVVILRSFAGFTWSLPWKSEHLLLLTTAVVFGKAMGGIMADWIGSKKAALLSLFLSFLLFTGAEHMLLGLLSVFFFNMTMPICLKEITLEMKNASGYAFGLLTFALFLGYIPTVLGITTVSKPITLLLIFISFLMMCLLRGKQHD
ncbi:MAG: hypothetical protein IJ356_08985 [Erysipelotrichaceae bacterium]|nr:hypothetical protein [Erysipelotrichaceae bacterium]